MSRQDILTDMELNAPIKSLVLREPFGSLMLHGKIETRTWKTPHRGLVLICTSMKAYNLREMESICGTELMIDALRRLTKTHQSKAIAIGRLVDIRPFTKEMESRAFVKFIENERRPRFGFFFEDVYPIEPFPFVGHLGLINISKDVRKKIKIIDHEKP